ncbi:MAG: GlsB/YeaQ/YmgE family stress response membrane protein [Polyangiaceae bacterium]
MGILLFIVFGFLVGLLARAIMPGTQKMGFISTILLGIAGSFIGGFLVALLTSSRVTDLNTAGVIGSVVGALVLLFAMTRFSGRALV